MLGLRVFAEESADERTAGVGPGILGVETDGLIEVLDGPVRLAQLAVCLGSMEEGAVLGVESGGLVEFGNRLLPALFTC